MQDSSYVVGFKDVYPWVWSVMLGVALTLADRRGAFMSAGARKSRPFFLKNVLAVLLNVVLPAVLFAFAMLRVGPLYPPKMDFWQILGVLYLASVPLGSHHVWLAVALSNGWIQEDHLPRSELTGDGRMTRDRLGWVLVAFVIPAVASVVGWRLPF